MRVRGIDSHANQTEPDNDIPHYFRQHLENPGAAVLMAAWRRSIPAPAEPCTECKCMRPLADMDVSVNESLEDGEH